MSAGWPLWSWLDITCRSIRRGPRVSLVPKIGSECSTPCGVRRAVGGAKKVSTRIGERYMTRPTSVFYGAREATEWIRVLRNRVRGAHPGPDGACPTRWQSCLGGLPSLPLPFPRTHLSPTGLPPILKKRCPIKPYNVETPEGTRRGFCAFRGLEGGHDRARQAARAVCVPKLEVHTR